MDAARSSPANHKGGGQCGEMAGGATAVLCCCPCTVVKVLLLALYKLPARICQRAKMKRNYQKRRRDVLLSKPRSTTAAENDRGASVGDEKKDHDEVEAVDEKELWERFYGTGFWRSRSHRDLDG